MWRDPKTQKWRSHGYFPPTVTDEDVLREFGGGEYWLQLLVQTPDQGEQIKQSRRLKLDGVHRIPAELPGIRETPVEGNGKSVIGNIPTGPGDINAFLNATVLSTFMDLIKTMKEVSTRPTPTTDPMLVEMMRSQAQVQTKIIELIAAGKGNGDSKKELLEMMAQMKELVTPPANAVAPGGAASTVSDMVKGMKELMGLKDIVEGKEAPPDPETAMWGAGMKALEVVGDYLTGKGKGGDSPVPERQQAALPPGTPRWKVLLLAQKKQLLQAASYGVAPDTAAEMALTYLPTPMRGVLTEFLGMPDHVSVAIQTIPELNEFRSWTEEFFTELHQQFMGGEEDGGDAEEGQERETGTER